MKKLQRIYSRFFKLLLILVAVVLCVYSSTSIAFAQINAANNFEDSVLSVRVEDENLSEGIFAFQKDGQYYLPVGVLADLFDIYAKYEDDFYAGFVFEDDKAYAVNRGANTITSQGGTIALPDDAIMPVEFESDDIYLEAEYFKKIWPVDLNVNPFALTIFVEADQGLPFLELLKRKKRQAELLAKKEAVVEDVPFLAYPYGLYSNPVLTLNKTASFNAASNSISNNFSVAGRQDLLFAQADYNISLNQFDGEFVEPENIRLRFMREDIHDGALPFGLKEAEWGDVGVSNRQLVGGNISGRGAKFTTRPRNLSGEFDLVTIDGISNPGWETELYLNNQLLRFGAVKNDGQYIFEDIPVTFGKNEIKVVFYGPQGQKLERNETYVYRSNMVESGKTAFSGGFVDQFEPLIPIDPRDFPNQADGLAGNLYAARGISDRLTLFASANLFNERVSGKDEKQRYLTAGALVSFNNFFGQAEVYNQFDGGRAIDLRGATQFKGIRLNAQASLYSDFENQFAGRGDSRKDFEFNFNVSRTFQTALGGIGLQAGIDHVARENGNEQTILNSRQTFNVGRFNVSNNYRSSLSNREMTTADGFIVASTNYHKFNLRNSLNYKTYPDMELSSASTNLTYRINQDYSMGVNAQRNFKARSTSVGANISRRFDQFTGGANIDWDSEDGFGFALRANTTLGPFGPDGRYIASSDPLRSSGPISAFTYHDKDYDGFFSDGDVPVENVRVKVANRTMDDGTNESGNVFAVNPGGLNRTTRVSIDAGSIEDPYFIAGNPGYEIYPRAGVVHHIELPLVETGAVDGTLRMSNGRPVRGLQLQLMDINGQIASESITASDGYFTFEKILPGNYTIRAAPSTKLTIPFQYVDVTPDNLFQFGMDIMAVDLEGDNQIGLDIGFNNDSQMNVNNILTLAKGVKGRAPEGFFDEKGKSKGKGRGLFKASKGKVIKRENIGDSASNITGVRIGRHPGKERVVLDLSRKTSYNLNYDAQNNQIIVEMPNAQWSAKDVWQGKSNSIISQYQVEPFEKGVKMVMAVAKGAKVATSGLLNADKGKKDRLYIDITRN